MYAYSAFPPSAPHDKQTHTNRYTQADTHEQTRARMCNNMISPPLPRPAVSALLPLFPFSFCPPLPSILFSRPLPNLHRASLSSSVPPFPLFSLRHGASRDHRTDS